MKWYPYQSYRNSEVLGLGNVPADWSIERADSKLHIERRNVTCEWMASRQVFHYSIPSVQLLGDGQLEDGCDIDSNKFLIQEPVILVSKLNPRKGTIIAAFPQQLPTVCSSEFVPLAPRSCILRFVEYVYRSEPITRLLSSLVESVTKSHQRVNPDAIRKLWWAWPPLDEQYTISTFLDRETARIDSLIAKKQRQIELLNEKRAALISHVVTKGLNPDVKMKNSGVEWLGGIPEHWSLVRLRWQILSIAQGWSPNASNIPAIGEEQGVLKLSAISKGRFFPEQNKALEEIPVGVNVVHPEVDDLLISRANTPELVGDACLVEKNYQHLILPDLIYKVRINSRKCSAKFVSWFILSSSGRAQINMDARGSSESMIKLAQTHIKSWLLPTPPIVEQQSIACYLQSETAKIHVLIEKVEVSIKRLHEYHTALITAAVTGKIDVRGRTANEQHHD